VLEPRVQAGGERGEARVGSAQVVPRFAIAHLKRASGKNELLEGQRTVEDLVATSV